MQENKLVFEVNDEQQGLKLREYLRGVQNLSSRLVRGAALSGRIAVNGKVVKLNYVLKANDKITFDIVKEESQNIEPEQIHIDVVYEDSDVIVVNKQPGIVVHPTKSYPTGTLANGLIYHFRENNENCIVRLVSRLDMDTSGLIIVAKNQYSHMALARDMNKEEFEKSYLAVIHGNMAEKEGIINLPIYRPEGDSIQRVVDARGQESITHFKVIESFKGGDLVKLTLETGRTHQIRVHLTHLGHPLYGDILYGIEGDEKFIKRQALHAYRLKFPHPRTGKLLELETGIPEDMQQLIEKIKN
ncbi:RluA family pseudouridine synthase [Clostridium sp. DJ247]|uniref:RluA family pseudouridine synthase n=1 Tax=Clostridium sp. DJ247 TaxID=2726188 RepID=UPI001629D69B|nr:RluA family pseudouridine synthase [Clostridium sp. DJ247]MBC2579274.1 RluA family pseudouridine synthase [Clostridium sp. DJ247]MBC2579275.1 RluA family pseudouridine synthase [Clostridium sp. DJ247]